MKFCSFVIAALLTGPTALGQNLPLVPPPHESAVVANKTMPVPQVITVSVPSDSSWKGHLEIFGEAIQRMTKGQHRLAFSDTGDAALVVNRHSDLADEAYSLVTNIDQIQIATSSLRGLAHATATLLQLVGAYDTGELPQLSINDSPTLSYRNFMVDMGRNPHSVELLKETIDLLWFYKVDSMQLHLTDDQRFAFPSTAFPKLWDGLITVEQFKNLEAYAVARGVTIIPELEVPGHSEKLRGIYPEVFGKTGTDLVKSDTALEGLQTLLDEIVEVFPSSPYIHIGGDEAFGVPEDLQRDLINKLNAYLKTKGKQTLVWEGPRPGNGDNKVDTDVIHINWRTINYPADQMLEDGYQVINATWDPLYLVDHFPRTNYTMTSPQHIYETLSITRFKHMNPWIRTYNEPIEVEPSERLIGFCMPWWEGREKNYFAQVVPRLIPFAEVAWNHDIERDFDEFSPRTQKTETARMAAFYPVTIKAANLVVPEDGVFHNETDISLHADGDVEIRYTLDGSNPRITSTLYSHPLSLAKSVTVRATAFVDGKQMGHGSRANFTAVAPTDNLALGKPVETSASSGPPFSIGRITDGGTDNLDFYLGYPAIPDPITMTIDLGTVQSVSSITVVAYTVSGSYEKYTVEVSADGKTFDEVGSRLEKPKQPTPSVDHPFPARDIRYVRVISHGNLGHVFDAFSKIVEVQVR
ncbi:family 20 glycosylhydrolase [Aporhodopirellula aestuarii]|uniref:beta-N-acetylhexosaminidase n=1 Tax=Aporhodopirellula aestuarii TaxID=2950107 RepID=A0ABT0U7U7_9BACT|nr:family 20 glycosylhydrolase [Aporhodopirellula aestuarii]MCM2373018.1 family 20 glycosylhydrolase [Aporhodopirellula aestuarii]